MTFVVTICVASLVPILLAAPLYRPKSLDEVVATLPAADVRQPTSATDRLALARHFVEMGRKSGDPRFYGRAQAAMGPWWDAEKPPIDALYLRASIRQHAHEFTAALADLAGYLAQKPEDSSARLMEATLFFVTADYANAKRSCQALSGNVDELVLTACTAQVEGATGQAQEAFEALSRALAQNPRSLYRPWALGIAAELAARAKRHTEAALLFEQALWASPEDVFLLASYADFLYDTHGDERAVALLMPHTENDGLLIRLARVEKRLGRPEAQARVATLAERFAAQRQRQTQPHLREEAMYRLWITGEVDEAWRLASENWRTQREPIDARLLEEATKAKRDLQ